MNDRPYISAGDLEKYSYCPLSWWLSLDDEEDSERHEELQEGKEKHAILEKEMHSIQDTVVKAKTAETIVLWFAVASSIIAIIGLSVIYKTSIDVSTILTVLSLIWLLAASYFLYEAETKSTKEASLIYQRLLLGFAVVSVVMSVTAVLFLQLSVLIGGILIIVSLVWLIAASVFLYISLKYFEIIREKKKKHKIKGDIEYVDDQKKKPKMLVSEEHKLRGRPDYILLVKGDVHIPVEVKTGRTPRGPLFSHILQLAAYCALIESEYNETPPYGILRYPEQEHHIDYDEDLKKLLISKLYDMRAILESEEAHRNHKNPNKCRGCSRRDICSERLD